MAAQTTPAQSMFSVQAEPYEDRLITRRSAAECHHPAEPALSPARGNAGPLEPLARPQVAIIREMSWDELSDEALISRYRDEPDKSIAEQYVNELFRRHHVKVARWCLSFAENRESAADLAQEICAKAYKNLEYFKGQSKFSTWLFSIARNHCLNAVRARSSAPDMESEETIIDSLPDLASDNPHQTAERNQLMEIARQFVNTELDETEKQVFTLHFAEEMPLDVITRLLNLQNTSGAKAFLVSARRKLDRAVKRWKAAV
ncbi:MAG TPA: sigma-70 family RNA polymerase sigma factor [Candidatus Angelobacter sp.]|nr:sigma-70 family RNA polymerase sigma factor [Candidatus Angelobacter sp.]